MEIQVNASCQCRLIFCCAGLTNPSFWHIKIIRFISHANFSFFCNLYFFLYDIFLLDHNKIHKKQKFSVLGITEWQSTGMWLVSFVTCIVIIAQVSLTGWSVFLFLDVLTLRIKLRIDGLVVKVLDSESRGLMFKTTRWLQGQLSLSPFRGR